MNKLFMTASAVAIIAIASCSNDETLGANDNYPDEIAYDVATETATRASAVYRNSRMSERFLMYAVNYNDTETSPQYQSYIDGDDIVQSTTAVTATSLTSTATRWVDATCVRYWPDNAIDFFAVADAVDNTNQKSNISYDFQATESNKRMVIRDYVVAENADDQHDMLYAVSTECNKRYQMTVDVNFRHALSHVVFRAKNVGFGIAIDIQSVALRNIYTKGTFRFGNSTASSTFVAHRWATNTATSAGNAVGAWDDAKGYRSADSAGKQSVLDLKGFATVDMEDTEEQEGTWVAVGERSKAIAHNSDELEAPDVMMVIPQAITGMVAPTTSTTESALTGTYIAVKCRIYDVDFGEVNRDTDIKLFPKTGDSDFKDLLIPVDDMTFLPGKKYIFTLVFGEAGNNKGLDSDDPSKPIIVPVTYNMEEVNIDDFILGEEGFTDW